PDAVVVLARRGDEQRREELAGRVRRLLEAGAARVVLLSGLGLPSAAREWMRRLGVTTVTKPARAAQLLEALLAPAPGPDTGAEADAGPGAEPADAALLDSPAAASRPRPAGAAPRILVADDVSMNQQVALHMLERLGYRVD